MPELKDPKQLFTHKLSKLHASEQEILQMLRKTQKEAKDPELASGFEQHANETEQQIANLERAFEALGEQPEQVKPRVVEGLEIEHDEFMKEGAPKELVDAFLVGAAAHVEHYEISSYEVLITMAQAMGQDDIVALLQENLEQEQYTLQKVQSAAQRLARQVVEPQTAGLVQSAAAGGAFVGAPSRLAETEVAVSKPFNPIEVQKNLKGMRYPASKEELVSKAKANGADEDLLNQLRNLGQDEFDGPDDVMRALGS